MKKFLVLSAVVCGSAMATPIGTCVPGALSRYIGNPCGPGENIFDNFAYSGNADASHINSHFQMAGTEFRLILPVTWAGFFASPSFAGESAAQASVAPNIPPAIYQIDGVKDPVQLGGPAFFSSTNSITTVSTLTGPGGSGAASPGLSSFELGTDAVVPEPASSALIGTGLLCLGLLRKRFS